MKGFQQFFLLDLKDSYFYRFIDHIMTIYFYVNILLYHNEVNTNFVRLFDDFYDCDMFSIVTFCGWTR